MMAKFALYTLIALVCSPIVGLAGGGGGGMVMPQIVYDPQNFAKNAIQVEQMADSVLKQAQMIKHQLTSLDYATKNLASISDYEWRDITGSITKLKDIIASGRSLSYSMENIDDAFKQMFPDFTHAYPAQANYQQTYQNWNRTTIATIKDSLQSIGLMTSDFETEQRLMKTLRHQGASAQGRMQVLQTGVEISAETVNQMQQLKRIVGAQSNAESAYMSYKMSKDSYNEAVVKDLQKNLNLQIPKYRNDPEFGLIEVLP